ncbi:MAG: hypothetical protein M3238_03410 [Actinomycetota bacterium]|nr:hypothetical protein [Actinomycetota bacterium]
MDVIWIDPAGAVAEAGADDLVELAARPDGTVWVDLPEPNDADVATLGSVFGFDPADLAECLTRSMVPKVLPRDGYSFFILHTLDDAGHLLELDAFLGRNYFVTVHGPLTPGVPLELALIETRATLAKARSGTLRVTTPVQLATDVIGGIEDSLEELLFKTAAAAGSLDRRAREGDTGQPETFLEELFHVRHGLLTVRNRSGQSRQACETLGHFASSADDKRLFEDLERRFERLTSLCDGEREFVQGVLDFFESITNTRINAAMNRLTLISFVVLPASALIGFFGISSISYAETSMRDTLIFAVVLMLLTFVTLRWTKSKGWW